MTATFEKQCYHRIFPRSENTFRVRLQLNKYVKIWSSSCLAHFTIYVVIPSWLQAFEELSLLIASATFGQVNTLKSKHGGYCVGKWSVISSTKLPFSNVRFATLAKWSLIWLAIFCLFVSLPSLLMITDVFELEDQNSLMVYQIFFRLFLCLSKVCLI